MYIIHDINVHYQQQSCTFIVLECTLLLLTSCKLYTWFQFFMENDTGLARTTTIVIPFLIDVVTGKAEL